MRDYRAMSRLRISLFAIALTTAGGAGWACGLTGCDLVECAGGFQFDLRVDAPDTDPITLVVDFEDGTSTWECSPTASRCTRENEAEGDRDFDVTLTMAGATVPFGGLPCDATACIRIHIRGVKDDGDDEGTYGPDTVSVAINDEDGEEYSREFSPDYERTENYGGEGCGFCDSLESFDERVTID
jgi:hypothetical protein